MTVPSNIFYKGWYIKAIEARTWHGNFQVTMYNQFKAIEARTMDKELDYFSNIDLSNEFEPVAFSIEDYDPEELDKLIDKLNNELEIALKNAEKQLFND